MKYKKIVGAEIIKTKKVEKEHIKDKDIHTVFKEFILTQGQMREKGVITIKEDLKDPTKSIEFKSDGKNSIYIGKHCIRIGTAPQYYFKSIEPCVNFYHMYKRLFDDFEVYIDKAVIVAGSFATNRHTLQQQAIPEVEGEFNTINNFSFQKKLESSVKVLFRKLKPSILRQCVVEDIYYTIFDQSRKPGFRYEHGLNLNTKQKCVNIAVDLAIRKWNYLDRAARNDAKIERHKLFPGLYSIGARNKRDYEYDEYEVAKSRVVHMPEFHNELHDAPWIDQITEHIIEESRGPIYIGNSFVNYQRLNKDLQNSKIVLEGDWKRFDSTLYLPIISCAVAILRCYYKHRSKFVDNHFISIYDNLCIKDYIIPGGKIFRLFHGLPSGVKSTNLLGSIINLLALIYCTSDFDQKQISFAVGGDDFLIINNSDNVDKDVFVEKVKLRAEELGMKFKFLDLKDSKSNNVNELPVFYKYTVHNNVPIIPTKVVMERIFIPWARRYKNNYEYFKFLQDAMPSLGHPSSTCLLYYHIYVLIYKSIFSGPINIVDVYTYHKIVSQKVLRNKIPIKNNLYTKSLVFDMMKNCTVKYSIKSIIKLFR